MTDKNWKDMFLNISIRYAQYAKESIWISESDYHFISGISFWDSRWFYLYSILDDILRIGIWMFRWNEHIWDWSELVDEKKDGLTRLTLESLFYEQLYWKRKMIEHLINISHFLNSNDQVIYKLFLYFIDLHKSISRRSDLEEFYELKGDKANKNLNHHIEYLFNEINHLATSNNINMVWFSPLTLPLSKIPTLNWLFKSTRSLYRECLLFHKSDYNRRMLLGESYKTNYWSTSLYMHASLWEPIQSIAIRDIKTLLEEIGLLNIVLLLDIYNLLGLETNWDLWNVKKVFEHDDISALNSYKSKLDLQYEEWDLIFISNQLAEIKESFCSQYWYKYYKIEYLVNSPLNWYDKEDYITYKQIQWRILDKLNASTYFQTISTSLPEDIKKLLKEANSSNEDIYIALKKVFIDLHTHWILIEMYRKR